MRYILFFLCLLFSIETFALSLDERRQQIIEIIDEELDEISRLSREVKGKNPDYLLRMAELNLEKARLWREKENSEYLSIPAKKRSSLKKSNYFKKSTAYFNQANKLCIEITRRFPRFRSIKDVYYILGYNAKESGRNKTAQKYLSLATKGRSNNKATEIKSKISLAEIYYNQKRYRKAIPLYESALRQYKDKWYTKDSFNLAWCYFRANRYSNAISKMQEVFS
jgi:tetratricopeptide (TPR) repeat protein